MRNPLCLEVAAIVSAASFACVPAASSPPRTGALAGAEGEDFVTFRVVDVMVSPTRMDGKPWDAASPFAEKGAREEVVTAMNHATNAKGAYDAASAALGHIGDGSGRPDVGGTVSVDPGDGHPQTRPLEGQKDSLTPHFATTWEHVPLTRWTTVRMYFVDKDSGGNDDIGAVVLSPLDLAAALEQNGRVHHLRVDDQTNGQILFVGIAVKAER